MPVWLNWIQADTDPETVLDPGLVLEGKDVILRDLWSGSRKPDALTIYEEDEQGWLAALLRKLKGKPATASDHPVREAPAGSGISQTRWRTKVGSLDTMQTTWRFRDKTNDARSGPLMVTHSHGGAWVSVESEGGGSVPVEVTGETGAAKVGLKFVVPIFEKTTKKILRYVSVSDPSINCRVLAPWEHGADGLLDFLSERESGIRRDALEGEFRRAFGPGALERPEGLEVSINEQAFAVEAGGSHDIDLTITAGPESNALVAVVATIGGDPSQSVLSDVIQISVAPMAVAAGVA